MSDRDKVLTGMYLGAIGDVHQRIARLKAALRIVQEASYLEGHPPTDGGTNQYVSVDAGKRHQKALDEFGDAATAIDRQISELVSQVRTLECSLVRHLKG